MKSQLRSALFCLLALMNLGNIAVQTDDSAIVQAILFYSPTCGHCQMVINDLLIPMQEQYGDQLQILGIDTTNPAGAQLYVEALNHFGMPDETGVPKLIIAATVLSGSLEIPEKFPGLVEAGLLSGGIGWPEIPDLHLMVPDLPPSADPQTATIVMETAVPAPSLDGETAVPSLQNDLPAEIEMTSPDGATLAWIVMGIMIASLLFAGYRSLTTRKYLAISSTSFQNLAVSILALIGLVVAVYLSYIEFTDTSAVCGPVGECNTVQTSEYAQILGIPIALIGIINYMVIGLLWASYLVIDEEKRRLVWQGLLGLTIGGTIFSIYLTILELFVIRAVCAWCLTSAVVTSLLLVIIVGMMGKRPSTNQIEKLVAP